MWFGRGGRSYGGMKGGQRKFAFTTFLCILVDNEDGKNDKKFPRVGRMRLYVYCETWFDDLSVTVA